MARVLSFLFADLVGSSVTLARLGEARLTGARRSYFALLREATAAASGRELSTTGDAVLVALDAPSEAIACAVALQRAVARRNAHAVERLDVRIGLQVGEMAEGEHQYGREDHLGGPVLEARRLCEAALGGQILVSSLVQALASARDGFCFSPVGLLELPGLPQPLSACEVVYELGRREQLPLPPELAATPAEPSLFVGRSGERERLARVWSLAEAGERQLAFVAGEPGIGKSRLADEFVRACYAEGAVVLWGRCFEEALVPYQPFVQALRHYVANCDPDELARAALQAAPLARLLPELAARAPAVSTSELEPETERYRLFEAIAALLAHIAAEAPLVLVLDDLQWADQGTLLLLRSLVLDARPAPMLVLGTYRDSEVPRTHPLAQLHADVLRDRPVEMVELVGLSDEEAASLVDALLGWTLPPDVARAIRSETEGNPFFLEEVVHHLEELGVVSDPDRLRRVRVTVDALGVPRRVKELVARRVQRLSTAAREALRVASVVGTEFRLDLLAAVLDEEEARAVALLDDAVEARLLFEPPTRIGEYGFTHALIQQALYEEQTANRRASLHGRIAETLEALQPDAAAALAHHFSLAGERSLAKVVGYGRAAGEQALALLAYEDAAREFARALDALARTAADAQGERAELLVLLGAARSRAGEADAAEAAFREAAEIASRIGAATTLAQAALGYGGGTGFGGVWTKFARVDALLVHFLEEALALVPEQDARLRAQLLGRLAQALYWGGAEERQRSLTLSAHALELARDLADPLALAYALDSRHVALWEPDNLEELRPLADEMLRVGEQIGDREIQLQADAWLITDALERAPLEVADRYVEAHARLARDLGQPYHLWYTDVARAMLAHLAGRFEEMAELIERAWRHGQTAHAETAQAVYTIQLLHLKLETGGIEDVIRPLELVAAHSPLPAIHSVLALAYAGAGRRDDALARVELFAADDFVSIRRDCVWSSTVCFLSDVVGALDASEYAPPLYRLLLPFADRNGVAGGAILCLGPVSRYLGMLARVNGDYEQALQHQRHALARSRSLGSEPLVARTLLEKAKVRLARAGEGDLQRAQELLAEVQASAEPLGMGPLAADAARLAPAAAERGVQV